MLPDLTVITPTLNRHEIVKGTIFYFKQNLRYDGRIFFVVSADGTPLPADAFADQPDVEVLAGPSKGYGANLNFLLRNARTDLVLQTDDDMWLKHELDVSPFASTLMEDEKAGWIRLYGVGFHYFNADLEGIYWRVKWKESRELHIPSMRPHIKHRRFHDHYGQYPEGLQIGATEAGWGHICKDVHKVRGGPDVLVPLYPVPDDYWYHADGGVSWREKEIAGEAI